jgi:hypothetical protein
MRFTGRIDGDLAHHTAKKSRVMEKTLIIREGELRRYRIEWKARARLKIDAIALIPVLKFDSL